MARNAEFDGSHGAQNSEKPKRFLEEQETRECWPCQPEPSAAASAANEALQQAMAGAHGKQARHHAVRRPLRRGSGLALCAAAVPGPWR